MEAFDSLYRLASTAQTTSQLNPLSFLPGFLTLTPLTTLAQRTAQRGISPLDALVLAPGLHLQSTANELHKGEYPACAALTSGYVFRVENPATVYFLQQVGRTGHLTNLTVSSQDSSRWLPTQTEMFSSLGYYTAIGCGLFAARKLYMLDDVWGLLFMSNLFVTRFIDHVILRRRTRPGWFGAPEPGVQGDLFILLSQDRWVRIRGPVDDLKAVTSGTWFSEPTILESFFSAVSKLVTYANIAVVGKATTYGAFTLASMLLINSGLLSMDNLQVRNYTMHGRTIEVVGEPKKYLRRRDLAVQLIKESGRQDWAIAMAMIPVEKISEVPATM